jgi:hypothetical protein
MSAFRFHFLLRVVLAACAALLAIALFFTVAANTDLAELINPHGRRGWIGFNVVYGLSLLATCALFLSLPPVLLVLVRTPAARSPGRVAVAVVASFVLVAVTGLVVSSLASALGAA